VVTRLDYKKLGCGGPSLLEEMAVNHVVSTGTGLDDIGFLITFSFLVASILLLRRSGIAPALISSVKGH